MLKAVVVEFVTRTSPVLDATELLGAADHPCGALVHASADAEAAHLPLLGAGLRRGEDRLHDGSDRAFQPRRGGREPLGRQRVAGLAAEKRWRIRVPGFQPVARTLGQLVARGAVAGLDQASQLRVAPLDKMGRIDEPPSAVSRGRPTRSHAA